MNTFASVVTMLIALGALFLSYRVFVRQKTFDNENHFFAYKLEQYNKIIRKAVNLHELYYETFVWIKTGLELKSLDEEDFNNKADKIDKATDRFRIILVKHSVFLPKNILEKLDEYYDRLYDEGDKMEQGQRTVKLLEMGMERLDSLENEFQDIINLVRVDLGIETIDERLKVRIGKDKKLAGNVQIWLF